MQGPNPTEPEPILSRIRNRQSSEFAPIPIDWLSLQIEDFYKENQLIYSEPLSEIQIHGTHMNDV